MNPTELSARTTRPTEARHSWDQRARSKYLNSVKSVGPMNADLVGIGGQWTDGSGMVVNLTVRQEEPNYDQPISDIICTGVDRR